MKEPHYIRSYGLKYFARGKLILGLIDVVFLPMNAAQLWWCRVVFGYIATGYSKDPKKVQLIYFSNVHVNIFYQPTFPRRHWHITTIKSSLNYYQNPLKDHSFTFLWNLIQIPPNLIQIQTQLFKPTTKSLINIKLPPWSHRSHAVAKSQRREIDKMRTENRLVGTEKNESHLK